MSPPGLDLLVSSWLILEALPAACLTGTLSSGEAFSALALLMVMTGATRQASRGEWCKPFKPKFQPLVAYTVSQGRFPYAHVRF